MIRFDAAISEHIGNMNISIGCVEIASKCLQDKGDKAEDFSCRSLEKAGCRMAGNITSQEISSQGSNKVTHTCNRGRVYSSRAHEVLPTASSLDVLGIYISGQSINLEGT